MPTTFPAPVYLLDFIMPNVPGEELNSETPICPVFLSSN